MATLAAPITHRRYRFNDWLSGFSERERKNLKIRIKRELRVDPRTLADWLDMTHESTKDVPYSSVLFICNLLGKNVTEALTEAPIAQAA